MQHNRLPVVALALCLCIAVPAAAQKAALKKAARSVVRKSSANTVTKAWKAAALAEAKQTNRLLNAVIVKNNQAQLTQLVDVASFRMYNEDHGLLAGITNLWSALLSNLHIAYFGPRTVNPVSPLEVRKQLLQSEARLKYAVQQWNQLKPVILRTATIKDYPLLSMPNTATRFLFEYSDDLDILAKEVALYTAGKKDVLHIMAAGQPDIEHTYRQMLAFAHGKGAFPFRTTEVYQILQLHEYPAEDLALLQKNLNSLECDILRGWGWQNKDIRRVIALYRSANWAAPYEQDDIVPILTLQHDLISSWRKYWDNLRPKDLAATQQLMQELRSAR